MTDPMKVTGKLQCVVVLTGFGERQTCWPISSQINYSSTYRLIEARSVSSYHPSATIIISGGDGVAEIMKEV